MKSAEKSQQKCYRIPAETMDFLIDSAIEPYIERIRQEGVDDEAFEVVFDSLAKEISDGLYRYIEGEDLFGVMKTPDAWIRDMIDRIIPSDWADWIEEDKDQFEQKLRAKIYERAVLRNSEDERSKLQMVLRES